MNGSATVQFKVRVHSLGLPPNLRILNSGTVGFKSKTLDEPGTEKTNEVSTRIILPDLEVMKSQHGRLRGWRLGDLSCSTSGMWGRSDPGFDSRHRHAAAKGHARRNAERQRLAL